MSDVTQKLNEYIQLILTSGDDLKVLQTFISGDEVTKVQLQSGEAIPTLKGIVAESLSSLNKARTYVDNQQRTLAERLLKLEQRLDALERRGY